MTSRAGNLDEHTRSREEELQAAEEAFAAADEQLQATRREFDQATLDRDHIRHQLDQSRTAHTKAIRTSSQLTNDLAAAGAQLKSLKTSAKQREAKLLTAVEQSNRLTEELAQSDQNERELAAQLETAKETARVLQHNLATKRQELSQAETKYQRLESQLERVRERATVLEELEERLEGLASGVKYVLEEARRSPSGPFADVCGLVADLFQVDVDTAPLVDVALGNRADHVVVASGKGLFDWLQHGMGEMPGRVSFLRLDGPSASNPLERIDLQGESGVIGRADQFVETDPPFASLARQLLGRTWLVDTLDTAARLAHNAGFGLNFVTSDGFLLDADGTLVVGPRLAAAGRLSRRSELRACRDQLADVERQRNAQRIARDALRHVVRQAEGEAAKVELELAELNGNLTECHHKTASLRERLEYINQDQDHADREVQAATQETDTLQQRITAKQGALAEIRSEIDRLTRETAHAAAALANLERHWSDVHAEQTQKQVAAARHEQRVDILRGQMEQVARDQQERGRAIEEKEQQIEAAEGQLAQCGGEILSGNQRLAELLLEKEQLAKEFEAHAGNLDEKRRIRSQCNDQHRAGQQELQQLQSQHHRLEMELDRLKHERDILCQRIAEDYGIDLRTAASEAQVALVENRGEIEREIAELRQKIQNVGAVNLDALEELDDLESRFGDLSQQYEDLVQAKATLERIIQRINVDSRQLFLTTLDVIRGHFRELFRRLFGGGEADLIVVDNDGDVLDCGVEIVARPPGKETRTISLLSGGERTLTCVALLLAVFRSKPAPFCVLDEVDAALDESNIDRFMSVLREFLSSTQFLVVTHSKKTMFGADTLYGVTMQESGVSKLVSVRLDDVSEDGHIRLRNRPADSDAAPHDEEQGSGRQAA
jgi:chromosome segregation protein